MVELIRIGYTRLFEVRVLHHYWLDQDRTVFDQIANQATKTERLLRYDVRQLLAVRPSPATATTISGLRGVFRTTGLGFLVAVPANAKVPLDVTFEFFVTVVAPDYVGYTAQALARPGITLSTVPALSPQPIVRVLHPVPDPLTGTRRVLRYKANVPVLSNLTGVARRVGAVRRLYLSRGYPTATADDALEALTEVNNKVQQRAGDPPNAALTEVGPTSGLPVFLHQGDVPATSPPAGSVGAPAFGIELADDTPPDVAAVIRLTPRRPARSLFNFAGSDGTPRSRVFEVHLQNRWTIWRYFSKRNGSLTSTEASPLPLTYFGNAGTKQKPSRADIGAEFDATDPRRIARLVSDIYV